MHGEEREALDRRGLWIASTVCLTQSGSFFEEEGGREEGEEYTLVLYIISGGFLGVTSRVTFKFDPTG